VTALPVRTATAVSTLPGARLRVALAASAAIHAGVLAVAPLCPVGSPFGDGAWRGEPLRARIVASEGASRSAARKPAPSKRSVAPSGAANAAAQEPVTGPAASSPTLQDPPAPRGLADGPVYFLASELDASPALLSAVEPVPPQGAPPDGGYLVLKLLIDEQGRVEEVLVLVADPAGVFDEAATAAFGNALFTPGTRAGVPVKSQVLMEMKFHPIVPEPEHTGAFVATEDGPR